MNHKLDILAQNSIIRWVGNCFLLVLVCSILFACSGSSSPNQVTVTGTVSSGPNGSNMPLANTNVTIYQVQNSTSVNLGSSTTNNQGQFTLKIAQSTGGGVYYAIASQSDAIKLMATLGTGPYLNVSINELTTIASAYAFSAFFSNGLLAGPNLPLQIASDMALNIASSESGAISTILQESPNAYETNTWSLVGTLGNITSACVRSLPNACRDLFALTPSMAGVAPTNLIQSLVNLARNPSQNISAIYALGSGSQIFSPKLTALQSPSSADSLQKLDAFTIAIKFNKTGSSACPFGGPANVAFDQNGYIWINNNVVQGYSYSSQCLIVLQPNGQPANGANFSPPSPITGGGILGSGFGVAIDLLGNIWSGNFGWGGLLPNSGSITKLSNLGIPLSPSTGFIGGSFQVQGVAIDQYNNLWLASNGNDRVIIFPNGDPNSAITYSDTNKSPFGVAIDQSGNAWFSYTGTDKVSKFSLRGNTLLKDLTVSLERGSNPKGIAIDSAGNAWAVAGANSTAYLISPTGTLIAYSGRGLDSPWGVSIDAADNVWIANFGDANNLTNRYGVIRLCGTSKANCPINSQVGDAISPSNGYNLPSGGSQVLLANGSPLYGPGGPPSFKPLMRLTSVNTDMAGNVWAANNWKPSSLNDTANPGGDGMVVFVGIAAPTRAPSNGPAKAI
jgi:sugar lactone lactonase YvrE